MIAGMVLSNLMYVVGAIAVATVVSGFVWLRHRRPKSLEAGIEMFSRELKALEPDRPGAAGRGNTAHGSGVAVRGGGPRRGGPAQVAPAPAAPARATMTPLATTPRADSVAERVGRNEARAPSPDPEQDSG